MKINPKTVRIGLLGSLWALALPVLMLHAETEQSPLNSGNSTTYKNPLEPRIADPWITKMGDFHYLTGTAAPGDQEIDWTPIWKSRDMVNWSGPYKAYRGDEPHYWAGDAYHYRGKYYIILTCGGASTKNHHYKLLQAPTPEGPYTLFKKHTDFKRLDPGIFVDTDGKSYLMSDTFIAPLSPDWTTIGKWQDASYDQGVREGPFMIKHNNRYNVFRAWNKSPDGRKGYQMMMGSSDLITGPYKQFKDIIYDGEHRPGHGGFTTSPDGTQMWLAGHCWDAVNKSWDYRWLMIDYWGGFKTDGDPYTIHETFTENPVPSRTVINGNIAMGGRPVNASDYSGVNTPAKAADGDGTTLWEAADDEHPKWLEVDLAGEFKIKKVETSFKEKGAYIYTVEGSYDRYDWTTIVDQSSNSTSATSFSDAVNDKYSWYRYIRITILSVPAGGSLGISEFKIINNNDDQSIGYGEPVTIQAERFNASSNGVKIEATDDIDGGSNICDTDTGEWTQYNKITIADNGLYDIEFRVASDDHDNHWKLFDGAKLIASESVGKTNGQQYWQSVFAFGVPLSSGQHDFILQFNDKGCNFNWMKFHQIKRAVSVTP